MVGSGLPCDVHPRSVVEGFVREAVGGLVIFSVDVAHGPCYPEAVQFPAEPSALVVLWAQGGRAPGRARCRCRALKRRVVWLCGGGGVGVA